MNCSENTVNSSIFSDAQWLASEQALNQWQIPALLQDWLMDPGSLTLRLQSAGTKFNVQILQHGTGSISEDEIQLMQCPPGLPCQVREVLLCEQDTAWVFAHSVIPNATDGLLNTLQNIGDSPLGQALFTHAQVSPGEFEFSLFEPSSQMGKLNTELTGRSENIYGRRRIFWVDQAPVLVAEVFLSGAPCYNLINKH